MTATITILEAIYNELDRLGISTDYDLCSGLAVEEECGIDSDNCVRVFDDYADGIYDASDLLETLEGLDPEDVSLQGESPNNIWQLI